MAKRKWTKAEREEFAAHSARVLANAQRTRELAERAEARLPAREKRPHLSTNAESLRALAERGQAKLDAQNSSH